jgi:uncharacterized protein
MLYHRLDNTMKRLAKAAILIVFVPVSIGALAIAFVLHQYVAGHSLEGYERTFMPIWRESAEAGIANTQAILGDMYARGGGGLALDYSEASKWYRRAANQGYANAQASLGVLYSEGHGVSQDYVQALEWLDLALASPASELDHRAAMGERRDRLAAKMTPAQMTEVQNLVKEFEPSLELKR